MKNQGVVKFFAIALVLVCIYQLSFTWKALQVEGDAREYAQGDKKLEKDYLDSVSGVVVYNLGLKEFTYMQVKQAQLNLGLDLKGGMNVVLEISEADIIESLAGAGMSNPAFKKALDSAKSIKAQRPGTDLLSEMQKQFEAANPNAKLSSVFASKENSSYISFASSNSETVDFLRKQVQESVDRAFKILTSRIDQFGVVQPTIQRVGGGRVMVELPGVDDPERVRRLLQNTAKLEFWETYSNYEAQKYIESANKAIKLRDELLKADSTKTTSTDSGSQAMQNLLQSASSTPATPTAGATSDSGKINQDSNKLADSNKTANDSLKQDSAKNAQDNPLLTSGLIPAIYQQEDGQYYLMEGAKIGYAEFKDTSKLNNLLSLPEVKGVLPSDIVFAWGNKPDREGTTMFPLYALKAKSDGRPVLEGNVVTDARPQIGNDGGFEISMTMDQFGSKEWKKITAQAAAANPKKSIAIVLDGLVYSAPVVQGEIPNGQSQIMGNFTQEEAKDLANILKAGKLPARARIVEEAVIGPTLGAEAVSNGLLSMLFGLLAVIILMYAVYNLAGAIADLAVFLNLFFIIGVLASLQAALTLPGIAGIILTMGMAVDANVLIYERVKEEIWAGRNFKQAIQLGFKNASSAIIDGNLTTLIVGIVLLWFGSGPVKGFAITLIIGLISSLFTAFLLTRVIFESLGKREKQVSFWFKPTERILRNANFDFIGKRKIFYTISAIVIIAGAISAFTKGFDLGVDFKGGWSYTVKFDGDVKAPEVRELLKPSLDNNAPEVKVYGTDNTLKITTSYMINDPSDSAAKMVESKLNEGLNKLPVGHKIETSYKVGPTIADDIKRDALLSVIVSLIGMFIYILIRFKRWQFALSTVITLFHDVLVVLAFFTLLKDLVPFTLELDQAFIAAILTVIGYSINDSVVVFDRVREYLREHKHEGNLAQVINMALNSTLSRTVITGLTTIVVVIILLLFGGETIRGFSFALSLGIIWGTYSSICIGSPMAIDLMKKQLKDFNKTK